MNNYANSSIPEKTVNSKVVIIGAGLAGLTAAYRLHEKGYDLDVYEARNRVGGRIHSALIRNHDGQFSVGELGAENITDGGDAKNIISLIQELGLETIKEEENFTPAFFSEGKIYDHHTLLKQENYDPLQLEENLHKFENESNTMQDILDKMFGNELILKRSFSILLSVYEGSPPRLLSKYHNLETFKYGLLGGISEVHQAEGFSPTIHLMSIKGGNALLPIKIANILKEKIHLQKVLKNVKSSHNNQIELIFEDGQKVVCDRLILAIPCSVFKDIAFDSVIPEKQLSLIKSVQYGTANKILVPIQHKNTKYSSFFTDDVVGFTHGDKKLMTLLFGGEKSSDILHHLNESYTAAIFAANTVFHSSHFASNNSPNIAKDEHFIQYTGPVAKLWVEDQYALGSYSNYGISLNELLSESMPYKNIEVKTIFQPIHNRIFFIGEHTTLLKEIGTMEAAVESGERIAKLF